MARKQWHQRMASASERHRSVMTHQWRPKASIDAIISVMAWRNAGAAALAYQWQWRGCEIMASATGGVTASAIM